MNRKISILLLLAAASGSLSATIVPDQKKVQTETIQGAIDSISESGGGVLRLSKGDYVTGRGARPQRRYCGRRHRRRTRS